MRVTGIFASSVAGLAVAGFLTAGSSAAYAQGNTTSAAAPPPPQVECDVDEDNPRELGTAYILLSTMTPDTNSATQVRKIRDVIKNAARNMERAVNLPGRNYVIAKALNLMLSVPSFPQKTTRGELGFETAIDQPVDIVVAVDSLFTMVEASNPKCASEIAQLRFSQPWVDMLTRATQLLQQDSTEAAKAIVKRAQILERKSPYTWQILATISARALQADSSAYYWAKTLEATGTASDTATKNLRLAAIYYIGEAKLQLADAGTGADRQTNANEAIKYFRQFLEEGKTAEEGGKPHRDSPAARSNLSTALLIVGDTAGVVANYSPLLNQPNEFRSQDHLQAGVIASSLGKYEDAARLFENALIELPFSRDALFNQAVSLFQAKSFAKMTAVASRLVEVDPNNPDNLELLVFAYHSAGQAEADAARKKAMQDTTVKYNPVYEKLKESHKVTYSVFQRDSASTTLTGTIENLGKEEKPFTLEFDFIDNSRAVKATGKTDAITVKPGTPARFTVKVNVGGVTGFIAKPLPLPPQPQ